MRIRKTTSGNGWGSPPRVRGHAKGAALAKAVPRITPAGAGTCSGKRFIRYRIWDHPRGCGDMEKKDTKISFSVGSPPRVRGHVSCSAGQHMWLRITPAGAGTCRVGTDTIAVTEDHPRGCGDMLVIVYIDAFVPGSPPRVRGHVSLLHYPVDNMRITPAGAGTWKHLPGPVQRCTDHPRGCGDMRMMLPSGRMVVGSPPRVRGHVHLLPTTVLSKRITPAGAGTCSGSCRSSILPGITPAGAGT